MNKIYKVIWNKTTKRFDVVSELAVSQGKAASESNGIVAQSHSRSFLLSKIISALAIALVGSSALAAGTEVGGGSAVDNSIAIGSTAIPATAVTTGSIAIGDNATAGRADIDNPQDPNNRTTVGKMNNIAIGSGATADGGRNISIGENAAKGTVDNWNIQNVNIGTESGAGSKKDYSVAIGFEAGRLESAAQAIQADVADGNRGPSVYLGKAAGKNTASYGNIALGSDAGSGITDIRASSNIMIGNGAGIGLTSNDGKNLTFPGFGSGGNTLIGSAAGRNLSGDSNVAIGSIAGDGSTGDNNVYAGHLAGQNSKSDRSIIMGPQTGLSTNNDRNVLIGNFANGGLTQAISSQAVSIGGNSMARGNFAVAIGRMADAGTANSIAIGAYTKASGASSGMIGSTSYLGSLAAYNVAGDNAYAVGNNNSITTAGNNSFVFGNLSTASAENAVVMGVGNTVSGENSIAIGTGAQATASNTISIGSGNIVSGKNSGAIGDPNNVSGTASYAYGNDNTIANNNTFVIGNNVSTTQDNSVVLGNVSTDRAATAVDSATVNSITYGGFAGVGSPENGVVSVGAAGKERQIINVAAGEISTTSTDAINGSQLYLVTNRLGNVANSITNLLGGNTTLNSDGTITGSFTYNGTTYNTVQDVFNNIKTGGAGDSTHFYSVNNTTTTAGNYNNDGATGPNALAAGVNAKAGETSSIAIGTDSSSTGIFSTAIGNTSNASGEDALAIGRGSDSTGVGSVAIGSATQATHGSAVAVGSYANASEVSSIAVGEHAVASAYTAAAIGAKANASSSGASAFGSGSKASGQYSTSIGASSSASGSGSVALGLQASAANGQSVAIGRGAVASNDSSVALGSYSTTSAAVGTTSATVGPLTYGGFAGTAPESTVSVGSAGSERTVTNVAAGHISDSSTDAINGSQLFAVTTTLGNLANSVVTSIGGGTILNSDGTINTSLTVAGKTYNNVQDALNAINISGGGSGSWTATDKDTNNAVIGNNGKVTFNGDDKNITVTQTGTDNDGKVNVALNDDISVNSVTIGDATNNTKLTSTSSGLSVNGDKITGVANGNISATSSDAVNGSQINAISTSIANNLGGGATVNADGTISSPTYNITNGDPSSGNTVAVYNVGDAISNLSAAVQKPLTFETDSGSYAAKLGATIGVKGDGKNISTAVDTNGNITVKMSDTPNFTSVTTGGTVVNSNGITTGNGTGPSLTTNGISAGGKKITNVAAGTDDTDAVNVSQLKAATGDINNKINQNDRRASAGTASAMAAAGLPQAYLPGHSMVAVAGGTHRGQNAIALGVSRISDNGKVIVKLTGATNSENDTSASVGVGYQW